MNRLSSCFVSSCTLPQEELAELGALHRSTSERYWKYFKRVVLYDTYYSTFSEFKKASEEFFADRRSHIDRLRSLLTENFQTISN
jgi:hypothetical protein